MNMKNAKHAFISTIMGSQASNLKERLHKIKAHTLILWGKKDPVIPVEFAREFHAEIKNSQVVIMKNAKHTPFYERPEEFSSIIIDFLEK
jgi:pimeloyl-ACP methyl ester carboxylesterase